ncbi:MAG TPA: hypothetical protein VFG52_08920 [Xanthomonadales bacterium]|nr:hypothetical protein [Xanthomonadales bacterium]
MHEDVLFRFDPFQHEKAMEVAHHPGIAGVCDSTRQQVISGQ